MSPDHRSDILSLIEVQPFVSLYETYPGRLSSSTWEMGVSNFYKQKTAFGLYPYSILSRRIAEFISLKLNSWPEGAPYHVSILDAGSPILAILVLSELRLLNPSALHLVKIQLFDSRKAVVQDWAAIPISSEFSKQLCYGGYFSWSQLDLQSPADLVLILDSFSLLPARQIHVDGRKLFESIFRVTSHRRTGNVISNELYYSSVDFSQLQQLWSTLSLSQKEKCCDDLKLESGRVRLVPENGIALEDIAQIEAFVATLLIPLPYFNYPLTLSLRMESLKKQFGGHSDICIFDIPHSDANLVEDLVQKKNNLFFSRVSFPLLLFEAQKCGFHSEDIMVQKNVYQGLWLKSDHSLNVEERAFVFNQDNVIQRKLFSEITQLSTTNKSYFLKIYKPILSQILEFEKSNFELIIYFVYVLLDHECTDEARKLLEGTLEVFGVYAVTAFIVLSRIYRSSGRLETAAALIERAYHFIPNYLPILQEFVQVKISLKAYEEAFLICRQALLFSGEKITPMVHLLQQLVVLPVSAEIKLPFENLLRQFYEEKK